MRACIQIEDKDGRHHALIDGVVLGEADEPRQVVDSKDGTDSNLLTDA